MDTRAPSQPERLLAEQEWLRALARALVFDGQTVDDLVQATWLAALSNPPNASRPLRPWLRRVMGNLARERVRAQRRREAREVEVARGASPSVAPDELIERVELQRLVAELVLALDEPFRTAVLLRYHSGLSAAEIARRDGVPAGTVRARVKEGLDRLRAQLDRRFGGDRRAWSLAFVALARDGATIAAPVATISLWKLATAALVVGSTAWLAIEAASPSRHVSTSVRAPRELDAPSSEQTASVAAGDSSASADKRVAARVDGFHGRVSSAKGEPVASALVWLYDHSDFDPEKETPLHATTTDARGRFEFPALDARGLWAFVGPDDIGVAMVQVDADELDIRLRDRNETLLIRGRIVSEQALHEPFVVIASTRTSDDEIYSAGRATITEASGRFALVASNPYGLATEFSVMAVIPGFKPVSTGWLPVKRADSVEFALGARSPTLRGVVVDTAGAPVEDASIAIVSLAGGDEDTVHSSADGAFAYDTLRGDGIGRLVVTKPGFARALVEHADHAAGADWLDLRVQLDTGTRITGRVRGAALRELRVELSADAGKAFGRRDVLASANVDALGQFAIDDVPSGRWTLALVRRENDVTTRFALRSLDVESGVAQFVDFDLPCSRVALRVPQVGIRGLAIHVLLVDAATGAVEARAELSGRESGELELPCVRDGDFLLRVHPGVPEAWIERAVHVAGRDVDLGELRADPEAFVRDNWQRLYGDAPMTRDALEGAARGWAKILGG